jgi:hypothetical protein
MDAAAALVRAFVARNPFATLQVVLDAGTVFPFDVFDGLRAAAARPVEGYLDRFHAYVPGSRAGSTRIVVRLPARLRARFPADWVADAAEHADLVWDATAAPRGAAAGAPLPAAGSP